MYPFQPLLLLRRETADFGEDEWSHHGASILSLAIPEFDVGSFASDFTSSDQMSKKLCGTWRDCTFFDAQQTELPKNAKSVQAAPKCYCEYHQTKAFRSIKVSRAFVQKSESKVKSSFPWKNACHLQSRTIFYGIYLTATKWGSRNMHESLA